MAIKRSKKIKESVSEETQTSEDVVESETSEEVKQTEPIIQEIEKTTVENQDSIKLHNQNLEGSSEPVIPHVKHDSGVDRGGLKGNPGQQARFNSVLESKGSGDVSKYFHSR
jgi:alanine racemase